MQTDATNEMEVHVTNEIFKVTLVQPLIEARTGEVRVVVLTNSLERPLCGATLRIHEVTGTTYVAARRFAIVPPFEDGGYAIQEIRPKDKIARTFTLRPVEAEVGSLTQFEVTLGYWQDARPDTGPVYRADKEPAYRPEKEPVYLESTGVFSLRVEARPEVYAALGAIERVRDGLLKAYNNLQETGRKTHEKLGTTWPVTPPLEAQVALGEESFKRLFEVIEVGVRVADNLSRRSRGGPTS